MHRSPREYTTGGSAARAQRIPRLRLLLSLTLITVLSSACATTLGAITGPVTGPITTLKHTWGAPRWAMVLVLPISSVLGPALGLVQGIRCDLGFVQNGAYGVDGHAPFALIFDPSAPLPPAESMRD